MSLEQCIAWLRHEDGWFEDTEVYSPAEYQTDTRKVWKNHDQSKSFPSETLDSAARAMPDDWKFAIWKRDDGFSASAYDGEGDEESNQAEAHADTELLARFRLAVACRMAMKKGASDES